MYGVIGVLNVGIAILGLFLAKRWLSRRMGPLPPGPRPLPFIGNLLDLPVGSKDWETFSRWAKEYGDLVALTVMGQTVIHVNSYKAAEDLLEKRSGIYSERPTLTMCGELIGWDKALILSRGDRHRTYRRLFHRIIGNHAHLKQFYPVEEEETRKFLQRVMQEPDKLNMHVRHSAGALILKIAYGYTVQEKDDPFVKLADLALEHFSLSAPPGAFWVDFLPALKYVPDWVPGAAFKRTADAWSAVFEQAAQGPFDFVKQSIESGSATPSFCQELLEDNDTMLDEDFIKYVSASLYLGGADTSVSAIYALFVALAQNSEVVACGQAEIDEVIGPDRLPTLDDRSKLPYINAITKEILRWNSVAPVNFAHKLVKDDVYEGYHFPAGTIVIANIETMLHDARVYRNPERFDPSRFLPELSGRPAELNPGSICFGFGRRVCPGLNLADASVFITCAMALAVFDIGKVVRDNKVSEPVYEKLPGGISHPAPTPISIKPRSEKAIKLILGD